MSVKRQATTQLNHENWDQEDPTEEEDMGNFKTASKDVLEKRVIRTAKRRSQASGDEPKKSVFSGFGGFNKAPPSSFDFLANLTNGNKSTNGSPAEKTDTAISSSLFGTKPNSNIGGMFNTPVTSSPTKSLFGIPTTQTSLFGGTTTSTTALPSVFNSSKANSTAAESPFKIQAISNSTDTAHADATSQVPTAMQSGSGANSSKSLFTTSLNTPFKIPSGSNSSTPQVNFGVTNKSSFANNAKDTEKKTEEKTDEKKLKYYAKLKGLNESVSDWIKKHVEETPLCILSPIFKDYEKYLKEIQEESQDNKNEESQKPSETAVTKLSPENVMNSKPVFASNNSGSSLFTSSNSPEQKKSIFANQNSTVPAGEKSSGFSFGINTTNATSSTVQTTTGGFSFGMNAPTQTSAAVTSSPFSLTTTTNSNGAAPFSFGIGKPFSFSSNVQKTVEQTNNTNEDEDEPPKVEFTPIVEENSIFDKRCKVFVKKDGNFVDKGVGTLYIKKIEESGKHQLLARANTNLGNVLLNLILTSGIPTQRLGKNNVMMVCIPTPDAQPPPTPILIRVKTSEEADELLETLNKYKV